MMREILDNGDRRDYKNSSNHIPYPNFLNLYNRRDNQEREIKKET